MAMARSKRHRHREPGLIIININARRRGNWRALSAWRCAALFSVDINSHTAVRGRRA